MVVQQPAAELVEHQVDESAVRRRIDNPKLFPSLAQCFAGLSPVAFAEEKAHGR